MERFKEATYENVEMLYDEAYEFLSKNFCENKMDYRLDGSDMFVINVMNDFEVIRTFAVGYFTDDGELLPAVKDLDSLEVFAIK